MDPNIQVHLRQKQVQLVQQKKLNKIIGSHGHLLNIWELVQEYSYFSRGKNRMMHCW